MAGYLLDIYVRVSLSVLARTNYWKFWEIEPHALVWRFFVNFWDLLICWENFSKLFYSGSTGKELACFSAEGFLWACVMVHLSERLAKRMDEWIHEWMNGVRLFEEFGASELYDLILCFLFVGKRNLMLWIVSLLDTSQDQIIICENQKEVLTQPVLVHWGKK